MVVRSGQGMLERSGSERLHYIVREIKSFLRNRLLLLTGGPKTYVLGEATRIPPAMERVRIGCVEAWMAYRPPYYDGSITLVQASTRGNRAVKPLSAWKKFVKDIQLEEVSGSHLSLIEAPAVNAVVKALDQRLSVRTEMG
jgi:thioesterase domain-containing protein